MMDVSKKYGLEYRLLHSITKGHPWYCNWGYEFGPGSFALSVDAYKTAVESLSGLPLSIFRSHGKKPCCCLLDIISYYQSRSEHGLVNIRDLFCFVLSLIHDAHKTSSKDDDAACKKHHVGTSGILCSWSRSDIERVEQAMLRVLRAVSGANWVSVRALKGAVCKVAPPELLDYCLKELGGKMTPDGMVVNARLNPDTGAFEYRLVHLSYELEGYKLYHYNLQFGLLGLHKEDILISPILLSSILIFCLTNALGHCFPKAQGSFPNDFLYVSMITV